MSRLDELPPDQRAALSLLLRQRKSYAEVAVLLGIPAAAVHDRAHAALAVLAPLQARELAPEQRQEIANYILSQQRSIAERLGTRTLLGNSEPARAWAQALSTELGEIAGAALPEVPSVPAPALASAPSPPAPVPTAPATAPMPAAASNGLADAVVAAPAETQPPASRLGGALLLAGIVVAVVVAVILLAGGGGKAHHASKSKTSATKTGAAAKSTAVAGAKVVASGTLHSPDSSSKTQGEALVLADGKERVFGIFAVHLPATTHAFYYAIWLYNSHTSSKPLAQAPAVGVTHKLEAYGPLPTYARSYREVLLTRETEPKPTRPGHVVLRGALTFKE